MARHYVFKYFLGLLLSAVLLFQMVAVSAAESSKYETLLGGAAESILAVAWPTTEYAGYSFKSVEFPPDSMVLTYRINAISGFLKIKLWLDFAISFDTSSGKIKDFGVVNYSPNAIIPPGSTAKLMLDLAAR